MKLKLKSLLIMMFIIVGVECMSQNDVLTLKQCIKIGIENNLSLQQKMEDVYIAQVGLSENRCKLIPVIQGYANFVHNVERVTSVTDGSNLSKLLGVDAPYMISRGLDFQTTGGLQLSMPLYNQTLYTSIQISDKMRNISVVKYEKAKEDLIVEVSKLYYLAQTTAKQIELIHSNISRMESLKGITSAFYENDMALEVDMKRVDINLENLRAQLTNAEAMYEQQLNLLRYMLDLAPDTSLLLSAFDVVEMMDYDDSYQFRGLSSNLPELKLLNMQLNVLQQQKEMICQAYLPLLSLVGTTQWTAFTDNFKNYFHTHPTNKWYNHTYWGVQLKIPFFDGLAIHNRSCKVIAQYVQLQIATEDTEKKLQIQYQNSLNDWYSNIRNAQRRQENYRLAESVYLVTSDQYKEGVASLSELLQDEMRMTEAQNEYISALYKYKVSELSLLKLTGQLNRLTE